MYLKFVPLQEIVANLEKDGVDKNRQYPFISFARRNPPEGQVVTCKLEDGTYKDFYFVYQRLVDDGPYNTRRIPMNSNGTRVKDKPNLLEWCMLPTWIRQEFLL